MACTWMRFYNITQSPSNHFSNFGHLSQPASHSDAHDASGWSAYCEAARLANGGKLSWLGGDKTPELKKMADKALKLTTKIEAAYEKEDTEMLIRLIKARNSLWT